MKVKIEMQIGIEKIEREVEGVRMKNVRSKVGKAIDLLLIQYDVSGGAKIHIDIGEEEKDEFANPER